MVVITVLEGRAVDIGIDGLMVLEVLPVSHGQMPKIVYTKIL